MQTTIICNGCNKELTVVDTQCLLIDEVKVHVYPCGCGGHADCIGCEDLVAHVKLLKEARDQRDNLIIQLQTVNKENTSLAAQLGELRGKVSRDDISF